MSVSYSVRCVRVVSDFKGMTRLRFSQYYPLREKYKLISYTQQARISCPTSTTTLADYKNSTETITKTLSDQY